MASPFFQSVTLAVSTLSALLAANRDYELLTVDPLVLTLKVMAAFLVPWALLSALARVLQSNMASEDTTQSPAEVGEGALLEEEQTEA